MNLTAWALTLLISLTGFALGVMSCAVAVLAMVVG